MNSVTLGCVITNPETRYSSNGDGKPIHQAMATWENKEVTHQIKIVRFGEEPIPQSGILIGRLSMDKYNKVTTPSVTVIKAFPVFAPVNTVCLVGRVGIDPDVKYFESGAVKCALSLAVKRQKKGSEEPDWFSLELWEKTAEVAANYVRKGGLIGVEGRLDYQYWQDKTSGEQRSKSVVVVNQLSLLGNRQDENSTANYDEVDF